jgi:RNA polymerase sigma-70 factor (ECF subfamily)
VREKRGVNEVAERAFRRHYGQIYRYVRRRTGDHYRAEELVQQVFVDAVVSLRETGSPTLAWLYTVAKRRFADEVRRTARTEKATLASLPAPEPEPEYGVEVATALRGALASLPAGQEEVVVMKLLRGMRFTEIGGVLGITEDAAKMRFVRALEALRDELQTRGVERQ